MHDPKRSVTPVTFRRRLHICVLVAAFFRYDCMPIFLSVTRKGRRRTSGRRPLVGLTVTKRYIGIGQQAYQDLGAPAFVRLYRVHSDLEIVSAWTGFAVYRVGGHYEIRPGSVLELLRYGKYPLDVNVARNACKAASWARQELCAVRTEQIRSKVRPQPGAVIERHRPEVDRVGNVVGTAGHPQNKPSIRPRRPFTSLLDKRHKV